MQLKLKVQIIALAINHSDFSFNPISGIVLTCSEWDLALPDSTSL